MAKSDTIRPAAPGLFKMLPDNEVHMVALGNMTQFEILMHHDPNTNYLWVCVLGVGCYRFNGRATKGYVRDKIRCLEGDAGNLADFINCQLGLRGWSPEGQYSPDLCGKIVPGAVVYPDDAPEARLRVLALDQVDGKIKAVVQDVGDFDLVDTCDLDGLNLLTINSDSDGK